MDRIDKSKARLEKMRRELGVKECPKCHNGIMGGGVCIWCGYDPTTDKKELD